MSEKNVEMMKKLLDKKKASQAAKQKMKPDKKIGSYSEAKKNIKIGGSNNKV